MKVFISAPYSHVDTMLNIRAALAFWCYLHAHGLIRTRREWHAGRRARGLPMPEDWEDDHAG